LRGDIGVGVLEIDRERRTGPAMIKRYDAAIAFGKADPERILIQHAALRRGRDKCCETDRTGQSLRRRKKTVRPAKDERDKKRAHPERRWMTKI